MATRLDEKIEQLESIVEKRLNLCKAIWHGRRYIAVGSRTGPSAQFSDRVFCECGSCQRQSQPQPIAWYTHQLETQR